MQLWAGQRLPPPQNQSGLAGFWLAAHWANYPSNLGMVIRTSIPDLVYPHLWGKIEQKHPQLLLKTFGVEDAGRLCGNRCSTALSIKRTTSNLNYLSSANEITCFSADFGERVHVSCMWRFISSLSSFWSTGSIISAIPKKSHASGFMLLTSELCDSWTYILLKIPSPKMDTVFWLRSLMPSWGKEQVPIFYTC